MTNLKNSSRFSFFKYTGVCLGVLTRQVAVLVFLEVTVQVGLLAETAVAQVALEGLLLVVDVADVTLQVGGDAEGAIAVFTPAGKSVELEF